MLLADGRFAPTPSGPLHLGSVFVAIAGYLDARSAGAAWRLRIEDIDPPRVAPGAAELILQCLEHLGLDWDGPVVWQSGRDHAYTEALESLLQSRLAFECGCTRRQIRESGRSGADGPVYAGTCRAGLPVGARARSVRALVASETIEFDDLLQGPVAQNLAAEIGDFVIRRADGLFAYQLAVVVDDAFQAVRRVVRGMDLMGSTTRQIKLQKGLSLPSPDYLHLPVLTGPDGQKLSKSLGAASIESLPAQSLWLFCLDLLGQGPDLHMNRWPLEAIKSWAIKNWSGDLLPRRSSMTWLEIQDCMHRWRLSL